MASLNLTKEELKSLEQTRQRLFLLTNSIGSLKNDILASQPLPAPASLQAQANILKENLNSLLTVVTENEDLFQRLVVHPSTNFPGRTQEGILLQLLRKKLEPEVEEKVAESREAAAEAEAAAAASSGQGDEAINSQPGALSQEDLASLWADMREWCQQRMFDYVRSEALDLYTTEEREMGIENVRTGLQRYVVDDDEEDEDDEDDEEEEKDEMDLDLDEEQGIGTGRRKTSKPAPANATPAVPAVSDVAEVASMCWFLARGETTLPQGAMGPIG